ncbi:ankyrin repeat-containing domain protein [Aspergillus carlsbadensis]|nr:ankyrin repeat-containing domain protein [Aspergillus carlsbadensis]
MDASLPRLPTELLIIIASFLDYECEINNLSRVNHNFYAVLNRYLYRVNFAKVRSSQPLQWAATHGIEATARKAIDAGAKPGSLHVLIAAYNGHNSLITLFYEQGADINSDIGFGDEDFLAEQIPPSYRTPESPLAAAAAGGHEAAIRLLIDYGVDIESGAPCQYIPLMHASEPGKLSAVQALAHAGAAICAQDHNESTPLYLAAREGHLDVV